MKPLTRGINHNTHPGEIISEMIIKANELTVEKTARLLHVSRPNLSNVVNGKSGVSPSMALRLAHVFGGNASFWIRLQSAFDLRKAEKEFEIKLDKFKHI